MKKLIVEELNFVNFFIILILKIFFKKIYFVNISSKLRNIFFLKILNYCNILWFDYQASNASPNSFKFSAIKIYEKSSKYSYIISKNLLKKFWDNNFKKIYYKKNYIVSILYTSIKIELINIIEIFYIGKILQSTDQEKIYYLFNNANLAKILLKYFKNSIIINNFYFPFFVFFSLIIKILLKIIKKILNFKNIINKFFLKKKINKLFKYDNNIIFFIHKGIIQNLNKLFIYRLLNIKKKNLITHIELNKNSVNQKSLNFYNNNKIPLFYWDNFDYKIDFKRIYLIILIIFKKIYSTNLLIFLKIFKHFLSVERHLGKINSFNNSKLAIIQDEHNISNNLLIALKIKKINTIGFQQRLNITKTKSIFLLDNYFVLGKKSVIDIKKNKINNKTILHKYTYLQKLQKNEIFKLKDKIKFLNKTNSKKICLILDVPNYLNWYENGRSVSSNWKFNSKFLKIIIKIIKKNKNTFFILKNKDRNNYKKISYFNSILSEFKKLENLYIYKNNNLFGIEELEKLSSYSICRYTSSADKMLFYGKPVFIYDGLKEKLISDIIPYSKNILFHDFHDLDSKIIKLNKKFKLVNDALNADRKYLYQHYNSIKVINKFKKIRSMV